MDLKHTPLLSAHQALSAKLIDFGGWLMPVQYTSIIEEHTATRQAAGLFDVSHMGEFTVTGSGSAVFLNRLLTNDVCRLSPGKIQYSLMLNERGGVLDDLLVYMRGENDYLLVVNASNADSDFGWADAQLAGQSDVSLTNSSGEYAQLAVQGPMAQDILQKLTGFDLKTLKYFRFADMDVAGAKALVSRTGYTGEDGFEIYCDPGCAASLWDSLTEAGAPLGLTPVGLGARDTLRFEAALPLYGHELTSEITPFEAGLGFAVSMDKGDFTGRGALLEKSVPARKLVGLELTGRGIAREGCHVLKDGADIGHVASGTYSPTFQKALATAYLTAEYAEPGVEVEIDIRGKSVGTNVVGLPFYKREKR